MHVTTPNAPVYIHENAHPQTHHDHLKRPYIPVKLTPQTHIPPFQTNRSGGIQGGISNGETVVIRVAFKPTSTIGQEQHTVTRVGRWVLEVVWGSQAGQGWGGEAGTCVSVSFRYKREGTLLATITTATNFN